VSQSVSFLSTRTATVEACVLLCNLLSPSV
jgi:hypothetical protein